MLLRGGLSQWQPLLVLAGMGFSSADPRRLFTIQRLWYAYERLWLQGRRSLPPGGCCPACNSSGGQQSCSIVTGAASSRRSSPGAQQGCSMAARVRGGWHAAPWSSMALLYGVSCGKQLCMQLTWSSTALLTGGSHGKQHLARVARVVGLQLSGPACCTTHWLTAQRAPLRSSMLPSRCCAAYSLPAWSTVVLFKGCVHLDRSRPAWSAVLLCNSSSLHLPVTVPRITRLEHSAAPRGQLTPLGVRSSARGPAGARACCTTALLTSSGIVCSPRGSPRAKWYCSAAAYFAWRSLYCICSA